MLLVPALLVYLNGEREASLSHPQCSATLICLFLLLDITPATENAPAANVAIAQGADHSKSVAGCTIAEQNITIFTALRTVLCVERDKFSPIRPDNPDPPASTNPKAFSIFSAFPRFTAPRLQPCPLTNVFPIGPWRVDT